MDSLKRLKKHNKAIKKIRKINDANPFSKIWNKMSTEEKAVYLGILNGNIELSAELVGVDTDLYTILKKFEDKMTEKYGK